MLCITSAKIRILSDIFTIFASWRIKRISDHKTIHQNILAIHCSDSQHLVCGSTYNTASAGTDVRHRQGCKQPVRKI